MEVRLTNLNIAETLEDPGIEVDFDDVRLDAVFIPEPTTFSLATLALLALLANGRRRRA